MQARQARRLPYFGDLLKAGVLLVPKPWAFAFLILSLVHLLKSCRQESWKGLSRITDLLCCVQYEAHYLLSLGAMNKLEPYKRDKIGSHLSYPLKFGELATLLSPAVEQLNVQVWFNAIDAPRQSETRDRYTLMEAQFWTRRPESPWWLFVRPVLRSLREAAHSLLVPAGTDRLRDWLLSKQIRPAKHPPRWHTHSPSLRIYFDAGRGVLEYETA